MSDKLNDDLEMINLDQTGNIPTEEVLPKEEMLPKEVTMDTQLLTDVSAEISLNMENTQLLTDIKDLVERHEQKETAVPSDETKVIDADPLADTITFLDLDKTSELEQIRRQLQSAEGGEEGTVPGMDGYPAEDAEYTEEDAEYALDADYAGEYPEEDAEYSGEDDLSEEDGEYPEEDLSEEDEEYPDEEDFSEEDEEYPEDEFSEEDEEYPGEDDLPEEDEEYPGEDDLSEEDEEYPGEDAGYVEDDAAGGADQADADAIAAKEADGAIASAAEPEEDISKAVDSNDARLFETGEIMHLEEGKAKNKDEVPPPLVIRKTPKTIIVFAAAVLCFLGLCIIIGVQSYKNRSVTETKPYMYDVGQRLKSIGVAGQSGLMAMAGADHGIPIPDDDNGDKPVETDPDIQEAGVQVKLSFTSVARDIKLKFINIATERLITDTPFEVILTPAAGEKLRLVDEDKDGIIYKKDVAGGDYTLAVVEASGFSFLTVPSRISVKENISYQKVDVKEEIKKESEVNAAVEDTGNSKPQEEPAQPANGDTVDWVESSKTAKEGTGGYKKVEKDSIPEPDPGYKTSSAAAAADVQPAAVVCEPVRPVIHTSEVPSTEVNATPTAIPVEEPTEEPTPTEEDPTPTEEPGATPTPTAAPTGSPSVTPGASPTPTGTSGRADTTSKLKDKNGNQLYVKNGDEYVEAVYADYYKVDEFYILTEPEYIYTGWQTFDGKTYYFDKNGNKVTGDQVIQGKKYHFDENGVLDNGNAGGNSGGNNGGKGILGIDVSKWNGAIDWNAVKNSGVNFVIIRCGYRGSSTGVLVEDPTFRSNIQGAQAAGLKVGLYFFTQAVNEVEAVEEASMCLSLAQGYSISYPIFIDVEFTVNKNGRADGLDKATRSAVARAFCETINNGGYAGGVYSSKSWYGYSLDMNVIGGYKIWLAHYTSQTDYSGHYDIWQYSSKGSISGIKGNVDMNYSYMGY